MSYIMLEYNADIKTLTPTAQQPLTFKNSMLLLEAGNTIILHNYETTSNADVFVRFNLTGDPDKPLTEISYASPASDTGAVWTNYPLPINALSLYTVYEFDANLYGAMAYYPGDTVQYKSLDGTAAGVVSNVYINPADNTLLYEINGKLYTISETPDIVNTDSNISGMVLKQPVADGTKDYHTIDVHDYENKVYVLY